MKKFILGGLLIASLLIIAPAVKADTISDLQAQISQLLAQIKGLQTQVNSAQLQNSTSGVSGGGSSSTATTTSQTRTPGGNFCYDFGKGLTVGSTGRDVLALKEILSTYEGLTDADADIFTEDTAALVVEFQSKYGIRKTGTVGPVTRAKLNALYGCGVVTARPGNSPVISGVSGPQTLSVNQQGTWTVKASSATGGNLTYSVIWGDEGSMNALARGEQFVQNATFTHSYRVAGTYTPTFTVTSENTIRCITTPCPSNARSAQTSISVKVGDTTQPSITVLSPNGGENWKIGETKTVSLNVNGAPQGSYLQVSIASDDDGPTIDIKNYTAPNGNISFDYVLPKSGCHTDYCSNLTGGHYKILAYLYDKQPCGNVPSCHPREKSLAINSSYSFFTITAATTQYHSADTNHDWKIDDSELTAFTSLYNYNSGSIRTGEYSMKISIHGGPSYYVAGPGIQSGSIHSADTNKDWKISLSEYLRVVQFKNSDGYKVQAGTEDGFAPVLSTQPSITVLSPNGGEVITQGQQHSNQYLISWTSNNLSGATAFLVPANSAGNGVGSLGVIGYVSNIYSSMAWDGMTVWSDLHNGTEINVPPGNYKIYLVGNAINSGTVNDMSNSYFTIKAPTTQQLTLSAFVTDASYDRAGAWGNFGPGVGNGNKNKYDWHWTATLKTPTGKGIKSMIVRRNSSNEAWSTSNSSLYPLVVYMSIDSAPVNTGYGDLPIFQTANSGASTSYNLFGQIETESFLSGGTLEITFTDGTSVSSQIESSSIKPPSITQPSLSASPTRGTLEGASPTLWVDFVVSNYNPRGGEIVEFGYGTTSALGYTTAYNSRHDYHSPGVYTVRLLSGSTVVATTQVTVDSSSISTNRPPTIDSVDSPTYLNVGQSGTWILKASDPENGVLRYFVSWGDQVTSSASTLSSSANTAVQQTSTFSHSYNTAGNYTVKLTVTDSQGQSVDVSTTVNVGTVVSVSSATTVSTQIPLPLSVDLKVNGSDGPITVPVGSTLSMTWTSTGATSCASTGGTATGPTSNSGLNMTAYSTPITAIYKIYCNNDSTQVSDSVSVTTISNSSSTTTSPTAYGLVNLTVLAPKSPYSDQLASVAVALEKIRLQLQQLKSNR